jgi:hypothetical protein
MHKVLWDLSCWYYKKFVRAFPKCLSKRATALDFALHIFLRDGIAKRHVDAKGNIVWKARGELLPKGIKTGPIVKVRIKEGVFSMSLAVGSGARRFRC